MRLNRSEIYAWALPRVYQNGPQKPTTFRFFRIKGNSCYCHQELQDHEISILHSLPILSKSRPVAYTSWSLIATRTIPCASPKSSQQVSRAILALAMRLHGSIPTSTFLQKPRLSSLVAQLRKWTALQVNYGTDFEAKARTFMNLVASSPIEYRRFPFTSTFIPEFKRLVSKLEDLDIGIFDEIHVVLYSYIWESEWLWPGRALGIRYDRMPRLAAMATRLSVLYTLRKTNQ